MREGIITVSDHAGWLWKDPETSVMASEGLQVWVLWKAKRRGGARTWPTALGVRRGKGG